MNAVPKIRYLTKTRFKMAMECPRKLAFEADCSYVNTKDDDEFLKGLADGGHQVGALAKLLYPGGIEITAPDIDTQVQETAAYMQQENVILFEPTFRSGQCLVRVDVLVKQGSSVTLVEVKSKSMNLAVPGDSFRKQNGDFRPGWLPYLQDIAYQTHVFELACLGYEVSPRLMLVDPGVVNTVPGLGALFSVMRNGRRAEVVVDPSLSGSALTSPPLRAHGVEDEVNEILRGSISAPSGLPKPFPEAVAEYAAQMVDPSGFRPRVDARCKRCEYYCEPDKLPPGKLSGWAECVATVEPRAAGLRRPETIFGLYDERKTDGHLKKGRVLLEEVRPEHVNYDGAPADAISGPHRKSLQCDEVRGDVPEPVLKVDGLTNEFANLRWPLHFIDFETGRYAIPLHAGDKPNTQLLYQFSEHVLHADGRLEHRMDFLCDTAGVHPNRLTLDALRATLEADEGTVLHWWDHERTVLDALKKELDPAQPADSERKQFIERLCSNKGAPHPRLVDLGRMVHRLAYFPGTDGRSSIKKVLPAVLQLSSHVRAKYGAPVYGTAAMPSRNFSPGMVWVQYAANGAVIDPYKLLSAREADPALEAAIQRAETDDEGQAIVANGGAAMLAYAKLQRHAISGAARADIVKQMLRYCELDTLAMVMVFEALRDWLTHGVTAGAGNAISGGASNDNA